MEKSTDSTEPLRDRLSELPETLIFDIFFLLPMRDVVRTATLSKQWRYLWTTAPSLNFDFRTEKLKTARLRNFINRALIVWRGARIQNFSVEFGTYLDKPLHNDLDLWVHFAMKHGVERLRLRWKYAVWIKKKEEEYWLPQCLYSYSSLTQLHIRACNFPVPTGAVSWNRLIELEVYGYRVSGDLMNKILMGCPSLERLFLSLMESHENLCIESSSLRDLIVIKYLEHWSDAPTTGTELRVSAPNLEILSLQGVPYGKCSMKVPCISRGEFSFFGEPYYWHQLFSGNDFVVETFRQILPSFKYVAFLKLTDWSIKAFVAMKGENMLPPFPDVVELELEGCFEEYEKIVGLLTVFPALDMLSLAPDDMTKRKSQGREAAKFEASDLPNSFLKELRTISITWGEGEGYIFPLIGILLKHASRLEKMVFRLNKASSNPLLLQSASEKVLCMPRSSPTAELVFL